MAEYTPNLNLKKPDPEEFYNVEDFNNNADIIDEEIAGQGSAITTLQQTVNTHLADTAPHSATSAAIAGRLILRDANGRAKVAAPRVGDDIPRKAEVDVVQGNLDAHSANTTPHSATSAAIAGRLMLRDANGRAKVAAPSASDDIARKAEVDVVQGNLAAHSANTTPHSGATPEFNGVKFPAIQVASADANTLDDYEEGTWTPVINRVFGSSPSEVTYTTNEGKYTKIGRIVFIHGYVSISAVITDGDGLNCVEGLPFIPVTTYQDVGSVFYNNIFSTSTAMSVTAHGDDNRLYFKDATRAGALISENWVAGALVFSLAYLTY
jgi:hypothetical protein